MRSQIYSQTNSQSIKDAACLICAIAYRFAHFLQAGRGIAVVAGCAWRNLAQVAYQVIEFTGCKTKG